MSSGQYGSKPESAEETQEKQKELLRRLSFRDFVDPYKPWVLVPEGSLLGYFDWVPKFLRHGPWTPIASIYIFLVIYMVMLCGAWMYHEPWHPYDWKDDSNGSYPAPYTGLWYYNMAGFLWMMFIISLIYDSPSSLKAWATYTVQSWTIVTIRHGLSALAPFLPKDHFCLTVVEYLRFPALVTASMTFTLWNFLVGPFIYVVGMKTPEMKRNFRKFFFNFRLTQLHVFNILFAVMNAVVASPPRTLTLFDFYITLCGSIAYVLFYLMVLDRIGVHLYPVFSPRTAWFAVTFTIALVFHVGWYFLWNGIIVEGKWRGIVLNCLEKP